MPFLTIREAFNDEPNFQKSVESCQAKVQKVFSQLDKFVTKFNGLTLALQEFHHATNEITVQFTDLSSSIFKEELDRNKIEKTKKAIDVIFNTHVALLKTMEKELIEPIQNVHNRINDELKMRKFNYEEGQKNYDQLTRNYSGLLKFTMDPQLAMKLVQETHQLYTSQVNRCQKYMDWIDYLNQIQSGSEVWWFNKLALLAFKLTRWHSDSLSCLRSTEPIMESMEEHSLKFNLDLNLDLPPDNNSMAEAIFRTDLAVFRSNLGLSTRDLLDTTMLKCALDANSSSTDTECRQGYLLFQPTTNNSNGWERGYFKLNQSGILTLIPSKLNSTTLTPIDINASSVVDLFDHPQRHNVLHITTMEVDKVSQIYLQFESTNNKMDWKASFLQFTKEFNESNLPLDEFNRFNNNDVSPKNSEVISSSSNSISLQHSNTFSLTQGMTRSVSFEPNNTNYEHNNDHSTNSKTNNSMQAYSHHSNHNSMQISIKEEASSIRTSNGDDMVIKVGQVSIRDFKMKPKHIYLHHPSTTGTWIKIMFTLKSNGLLCQYHEQDKTLLSSIDLKQVARFNIRPLDDSYFFEKACFLIDTKEQQFYFKVATKFERNVWLCLIKGFAQPEVLGKILPLPKVYRVSRSFWLRVIDGRNFQNSNDNLYCQLLLDSQLTAFTSTKFKTNTPFWREDFLFDDLATFELGVTINVLSNNKYHKDTKLGHCFIPVRSIRPGEFYEGWYPIIQGDSKGQLSFNNGKESNNNGVEKQSKSSFPSLHSPFSLSSSHSLNNSKPTQDYVADLRLKLRYDEIIVLKSSEYSALLDLILVFDNDLVYDLVIGPKHLDWVAETLLKIYCSKHQSIQWLNYLAAKEVKATEDANILFRGNSILTKAIDAYMKMVGLQYVDETIGDIVRQVCQLKIVCEVDSAKLSKPEDVKNQWKTLFSYADMLWQAIQNSRAQCPRELRYFFNHLRQLITEKFDGDPEQLLMSRYTCVSGFIFLRLFCPAVLSPKLFGLVREHPDPKTHRTLTLLAKSLQCLANLADFGVKEPYMAQMNNFITDNMNDLMDFIDYVASPPSADISLVQNRYPLPPHPTGFHAPLPPYVIDLDRELSFLCGYVVRYSKQLKQVAGDPQLRRSKQGKLEKLVTVCNAIEFMVKDCIQGGSEEVTGLLDM